MKTTTTILLGLALAAPLVAQGVDADAGAGTSYDLGDLKGFSAQLSGALADLQRQLEGLDASGTVGPDGVHGQLEMDGARMQGDVDERGARGTFSLGDAIKMQGQANEGGASGSLNLGGQLKMQGNASKDGASGGIDFGGGMRLGGSVDEKGVRGSFNFGGKQYGANIGPDGISTSGFDLEAMQKAMQNLGPDGTSTSGFDLEAMQKAMQEGFARSQAAMAASADAYAQARPNAASVQGLLSSIRALGAQGAEVSDLEPQIQRLMSRAKPLDDLAARIMKYAAQGKVPPEALTAELSKQSEPFALEVGKLSEAFATRAQAWAQAQASRHGSIPMPAR